MSIHAFFAEPDVRAIMNPDGSAQWESISSTEVLLYRHAKMAVEGGFGSVKELIDAGVRALERLPSDVSEAWSKLIRFQIFKAVQLKWSQSATHMDRLKSGRSPSRQTSFAVAIAGEYCIELGDDFVIGLDRLRPILEANGWHVSEIIADGLLVPPSQASERFGEFIISIVR